MPKSIKILLLGLSLVVTTGMLLLVLQGNIAPKSRGIIKASGFDGAGELGKYSYRQLYGRLVYVEQIQFGFPAEKSAMVDEFLRGFLSHAQEQQDSRWQEGAMGSLGPRILLRPGESVFRASTKESVVEKEVRRIYIEFGDLLSPTEMDGLASRCKETPYFFDYECIRQRISLVAAGKWHKISRCFVATLDQVAKKDYLILTHTKTCKP